MPSRIAVITIDALHPRMVADFWCDVLGWHVVDEDDEWHSSQGGREGWRRIS